jgi:hypothetical protein
VREENETLMSCNISYGLEKLHRVKGMIAHLSILKGGSIGEKQLKWRYDVALLYFEQIQRG